MTKRFKSMLHSLGFHKRPIPDQATSPDSLDRSWRHSLAAANNDFTCSLYGLLRQGAGNIFFSPYGIRTGLVPLHAGARGETSKQMSKVLGFPAAPREFQAQYASFMTHLAEDTNDDCELITTNSLWGQEGTEILDEYNRMVEKYHGGVRLVDFIDHADHACRTMNSWVSEHTREKIQKIIDSCELNPSTRLILLNAVYFKGAWQSPFREQNTREAPFKMHDGKLVQTQLMNQTLHLPYVKGKGFTAAVLPYLGNKLCMMILLPDRHDGLPSLELSLSRQFLDDCLEKTKMVEVKLSLPRFTISWETDEMPTHLGALGMSLAFNPEQADFSGINGRRPPDLEAMHISRIRHKAYVQVNEEGTEAAAVTMFGMITGIAPEPVVFRANHPFFFAIRDMSSGTVLFLGRVVVPTLDS
jgi:serpin B